MERRGGFTLIELMVVVAMIAILVATIVPVMTGSRDEASVRACGRELVSLAKLAWSRAVTTARDQRVRVSQSPARAWIEEKSDSGPSAGEWTVVEEVSAARMPIPEGVRVVVEDAVSDESSSESLSATRRWGADEALLVASSPADAVRFASDGTVEHRRWTVCDRAGLGIVLETEPWTGRVRIVESGRVAGKRRR